MKKDCRVCAFVLSTICLFILVVGCSHVVKSVDYYNACLNDPVCYEEIRSVNELSRSVVIASADSYIGDSSISEFIGAVVASMLSFGLGVLRGKKLKKVV